MSEITLFLSLYFTPTLFSFSSAPLPPPFPLNYDFLFIAIYALFYASADIKPTLSSPSSLFFASLLPLPRQQLWIIPNLEVMAKVWWWDERWGGIVDEGQT
ncbi:hypothetical protein Ahy_A02g008848 isoform B [Arachis hypogaea]|uniref:Uncharacterized protein n=1 Tax=Arachis hypogaea TaxID=3818 RepID=A0A445EFK3_ARAHY|nr:hypothetical protein Ahy_A02g008848 isoform B [Arachis hypogaea]